MPVLFPHYPAGHISKSWSRAPSLARGLSPGPPPRPRAGGRGPRLGGRGPRRPPAPPDSAPLWVPDHPLSESFSARARLGSVRHSALARPPWALRASARSEQAPPQWVPLVSAPWVPARRLSARVRPRSAPPAWAPSPRARLRWALARPPWVRPVPASSAPVRRRSARPPSVLPESARPQRVRLLSVPQRWVRQRSVPPRRCCYCCSPSRRFLRHQPFRPWPSRRFPLRR